MNLPDIKATRNVGVLKHECCVVQGRRGFETYHVALLLWHAGGKAWWKGAARVRSAGKERQYKVNVIISKTKRTLSARRGDAQQLCTAVDVLSR